MNSIFKLFRKKEPKYKVCVTATFRCGQHTIKSSFPCSYDEADALATKYETEIKDGLKPKSSSFLILSHGKFFRLDDILSMEITLEKQ